MSCTHFNDAGRTGMTDVPVRHTHEQHHEGCAFANATGSAEKRTLLTTGKRLARLNQAAGLLGRCRVLEILRSLKRIEQNGRIRVLR